MSAETLREQGIAVASQALARAADPVCLTGDVGDYWEPEATAVIDALIASGVIAPRFMPLPPSDIEDSVVEVIVGVLSGTNDEAEVMAVANHLAPKIATAVVSLLDNQKVRP